MAGSCYAQKSVSYRENDIYYIDMDIQQDTMGEKKESSLMDKLLFWVIALLIGLLPIFIIPVPSFASLSKGIFYEVLVLASLAILVIAYLRKGEVFFPKSLVIGGLSLITLVTLISSFFSGHVGNSFIGTLDIDTVMFYICGLILVYAIPLVFISKRRLGLFFDFLFVSVGVAIIFHLLRLAFPGFSFLSLGVFSNSISNLIGSWNDMGIFAGLILILSLFALEVPNKNQVRKFFLWTVLILSFLVLSIINVTVIWIGVATAALLVFVYHFSMTLADKTALPGAPKPYQVPALPLVAVIIAVFFILIGLRTNPYAALASLPKMSFFNNFNVTVVEGRPALLTTYDIGVQVLKAKHVFGVGPDRFFSAWDKYKPLSVNQYQFWNSEFSFGYGIIPSSFVTLGILGVLAWIAFLLAFVWTGIKTVFRRSNDQRIQYFGAAAFIGGLYLWIYAFIYTPGMTVYIFAFVFTGILLAVKGLSSDESEYSIINFINDPRVAFGWVLGLVVLLLASIIGIYWIGDISVANAYLLRGANQAANGDQNGGAMLVTKSIQLHETDTAYRLLSSISLANAQGVAGSPNAAAQIQTIIQNALNFSGRAVVLDGGNYNNLVAVGQIYESVTTSQANDQNYANALSAYKSATLLNPTTPLIPLLEAELEAVHGNKDQAQTDAVQAINQKPDYTDAYFFLAQLLFSENKGDSATQVLSVAAQRSPNDPTVWFQLGIAYYDNASYSNAASAFVTALNLNSQFANAQYFLALSFDKLGRHDDALKILEFLKQNNPSSTDLDKVIANIKAGLPAVSSTATSTPTPGQTSTSTIGNTKSTTTSKAKTQ